MPDAPLPQDPTDRQTFTLRGRAADGTVHETELTAAQALDLASGRHIGPVRDERVAVEADGTIVRRDSAVPRDAA